MKLAFLNLLSFLGVVNDPCGGVCVPDSSFDNRVALVLARLRDKTDPARSRIRAIPHGCTLEGPSREEVDPAVMGRNRDLNICLRREVSDNLDCIR